eukprot:TRINITY_DN5668_c0_g1_i1.p1 TRINITY_DN5668_c0_g1~~TRINITY_DN5668_c0_g1_i1.p1  ORF type:complete len:116 (+),score=21.27 TRINITY_DN5668_c0_g1_i1:37-384(+)
MESDDVIELTNESRAVATITVLFTEYEYKLYIDKMAAVSFSTQQSDIKPTNCIDISDCLKLYTAAEVLDDVVWKCPACHRQGQPSKQLHLWRLPQILIIHLKRFCQLRGVFSWNR